MRRLGCAGLVIAALGIGLGTSSAQTRSIVREVRSAINCTSWPCAPTQDFADGEAILERYRAQFGTTSQALEALSWLARAALAANELDRARTYAADTYDLAVDALKDRALKNDVSLQNALGAAIEVQGQVRAARGQRSEAVYFLRRDLDTYRDTPLGKRIQKNINLLSLEGQPAPPLDAREFLGRSIPSFDALTGKVVLLFFWAHWCPDCKTQAPIIAALLTKYRQQGLAVVAPTQRYGYIKSGQATTPDEELQHIVQVRDAYYSFLRDEPVPVSESNHLQYGVSTTPTLALVDRRGIIRLYHPGTMSVEDLEAAIRPLVNQTAAGTALR